MTLKFLALFNHKLKLGSEGRAETFQILEKSIQPTDRVFWFHCASLGEYEQGLPVFKNLRNQFPDHKIVLTFFSPSGYEIRKTSPIANAVAYLPLDTPNNAKRFLDLVHPEYTIFVKYDIWPNYLKELKQRKNRALLISAAFRKNQIYFKVYGGIFRNALTTFDHIFVQNPESKQLLASINITNVTVAGDTRYDRVTDQLSQDNSLSYIEEFKKDQLCIVIGSSWPEDEALLIQFINNNKNNLKFIIAPHTLKQNHIQSIVSKLKVKTVLFSEKEGKQLSDYSVFIIDTIGILTKIYSYADIAYVGGAMGTTGLHNILEPAVFGIPVIIGKNYEKFPEAKKMINEAGVTAISNFQELDSCLNELIENPKKRSEEGALNARFISIQKGAVIQITDYIRI